jgi:Cof subfamily protein (haloacid dehalogenase superfamily)
MAVKLVALDIDGTIVHPGAGDTPTPRLKAAVAAAQEAGVTVVLASGRMFPGTASVARHLGLTGWLICQQGCGIHTMTGEMLHEFPIEHDRAMHIIDYAKSLDRAYEWFSPLRYIASRQSYHTDEYGALSGITPEYHPFPEHSGMRPTGVGIISTKDEAPSIHRALTSHHGDALHLLDFPEVTVAVAPEANKGHALSLVCADLGIDRYETIAVGDGVNDAAMLAWAGRGFAMAHSDRYALDAADEVLDASDDPVAELLEGLVAAR